MTVHATLKARLRRGWSSVALCAVALVACNSGPKYPANWKAAEVSAPSENILWAVASQEMQRMGFPLGAGADPSLLAMSSAWKTQLAPFKGDGIRQRAEVRFEARKSGRYGVEARIVKEINDDIVRPLDPSYAKWIEAPDDVETAQVLLHRIQARLGAKLEVGEKKSQLPAPKR